jgi:hypothetical protein
LPINGRKGVIRWTVFAFRKLSKINYFELLHPTININILNAPQA